MKLLLFYISIVIVLFALDKQMLAVLVFNMHIYMYIYEILALV